MNEPEYVYEFSDGVGDPLDTWRTRLSLEEVLDSAPTFPSAHATMRALLMGNEGVVERDGELVWDATQQEDSDE